MLIEKCEDCDFGGCEKKEEFDRFIYVEIDIDNNDYNRVYCVKCFIEEEWHKKIHAKDLFINNYRFNKLRKEDNSSEMKTFVDYHDVYDKVHSIVELLEKECEFYDELQDDYILYSDMTPETLLSNLDSYWCFRDRRFSENRLCKTCETNLRTVAYYNSIDKMNDILNDWESIEIPDDFIHKPIKIAPLKFRYIPEDWKIYDGFWGASDKDLIPYIDELQHYDVVHMGKYFNSSIEPLLQLKNLKGIIFGSRFRGNIDCLESLEHLEFVELPSLYRQRINEKMYKISYI